MVDLLLAARWLLAAVLVSAGVAKLSTAGRDSVTTAIASYGVLPRRLMIPFAVALPWVEIALGGSLGLGVMLRVSGTSVAAMLGAFAAVIGWHLLRGHRFACGCGGQGQISWRLVGRDVAFAALGAAVGWGPSAGLALWPGWGATAVDASVRSLLPIPLIVIVLLVLLRALTSTVRSGSRRLAPRASTGPGF